MRVNVYSEELLHGVRDAAGERVYIEKQKAKGVEKFHHFGLRFLVGERVPHTEGDDDTSAVTFWFASGFEKNQLIAMLETALEKVRATEVEA